MSECLNVLLFHRDNYKVQHRNKFFNGRSWICLCVYVCVCVCNIIFIQLRNLSVAQCKLYILWTYFIWQLNDYFYSTSPRELMDIAESCTYFYSETVL